MTMAMIMPIPKAVMYVSVFDAGMGVGAAVGSGAGSTAKLVSEYDGQ
jgi:hypothetical protein